MRTRNPESPAPALNLLPFLDLVLSFIGILLVIYALQIPDPPQSGRPLAVDLLAICQRDGEVWLYSGPDAAPRVYPETELGGLFEAVSIHAAGTRNLVFAFSHDCLATRSAFEEAFGRFTQRLQPAAPGRAVMRLSLRPLAADPEAVARLLEAWRGHGD
ncbi:hypothetical protein GWK36_02580 [Caldichromatium japonicum]|uniref:Uncharacterized protein n=1 Tax=Caldichromatium japonicum TaxID=2699430 RepID=A0A6G7VAM9_9GAMM|nr:hypothetical protein [Caldichromatium japonicum]QIK37071.1 hypothetical protein GWK36_02580 [Caldichromatium japonicum]